MSGDAPLNESRHLAELIGHCALLGNRVEHALRLLHRALAGPGPARILDRYAVTVDSLITQCQTMLPLADAEDEWKEFGAKALAAAKGAYVGRNRVVHGEWAAIFGEPGKFEARLERRGAVQTAVQTRAHVQGVNDRLSDAYWRCRSLAGLVAGETEQDIPGLFRAALRGETSFVGGVGVGVRIDDKWFSEDEVESPSRLTPR